MGRRKSFAESIISSCFVRDRDWKGHGARVIAIRERKRKEALAGVVDRVKASVEARGGRSAATGGEDAIERQLDRRRAQLGARQVLLVDAMQHVGGAWYSRPGSEQVRKALAEAGIDAVGYAEPLIDPEIAMALRKWFLALPRSFDGSARLGLMQRDFERRNSGLWGAPYGHDELTARCFAQWVRAQGYDLFKGSFGTEVRGIAPVRPPVA